MMERAIPIDEDEELDDFSFLYGDNEQQAEQRADRSDTEWSDWGRAVKAGAGSLVSSLGGAAKYAGAESVGSAVTDWGNEVSKSAIDAMTPQARREFTANFLSNDEESDLWDDNVSTTRALGLKAIGNVPSLVASLLPGALVGRAALAVGATRGAAAVAGTAAAGSVDAASTAGEIVNQIENEIKNASVEDLQRDNAGYRELISKGLTDEQARERIIAAATDYKPLIGAAVTLGLSSVGIEGLASRLVAGTAKRGVIRNAGAGALGEGVTETLQEGAGNALSQVGVDEAIDSPFDWEELLNNALEGGAVGGISGGVVGGALGRMGREGEDDAPAQNAPTNNDPEDIGDPVDIDPAILAALDEANKPVFAPREETVVDEVVAKAKATVEAAQPVAPAATEATTPPLVPPTAPAPVETPVAEAPAVPVTPVAEEPVVPVETPPAAELPIPPVEAPAPVTPVGKGKTKAAEVKAKAKPQPQLTAPVVEAPPAPAPVAPPALAQSTPPEQDMLTVPPGDEVVRATSTTLLGPAPTPAAPVPKGKAKAQEVKAKAKEVVNAPREDDTPEYVPPPPSKEWAGLKDSPYEEGVTSPSAKIKNGVRAWVRSLSDVNFDRLVDKYGKSDQYRFPYALADTMDPEWLRAEWEGFLKGSNDTSSPVPKGKAKAEEIKAKRPSVDPAVLAQQVEQRKKELAAEQKKATAVRVLVKDGKAVDPAEVAKEENTTRDQKGRKRNAEVEEREKEKKRNRREAQTIANNTKAKVVLESVAPMENYGKATPVQVQAHAKKIYEAARKAGLTDDDIGKRNRKSKGTKNTEELAEEARLAQLRGYLAFLQNARAIANLKRPDRSKTDAFVRDEVSIRAGAIEAALETRREEATIPAPPVPTKRGPDELDGNLDTLEGNSNSLGDNPDDESLDDVADETAVLDISESVTNEDDDTPELARLADRSFEERLTDAEREAKAKVEKVDLSSRVVGFKDRSGAAKVVRGKLDLGDLKPAVTGRIQLSPRIKQMLAKLQSLSAGAAQTAPAPSAKSKFPLPVYGETTFGQAAAKFLRTPSNAVDLVGQQLTMATISRQARGVPVAFATDDDVRAYADSADADVPDGLFTAGFYDRGTNTIIINEDTLAYPELLQEVLVHEAAHAAFEKAVNSPRGEPFVDALRLIRDITVQSIGETQSASFYGLSEYDGSDTARVDEFIAEIFSSKDLRSLLANIPLPPEIVQELEANGVYKAFPPRSLWQFFVQLVKQALGIPNAGVTALEAALWNARALNDTQLSNIDRVAGAADLNAATSQLRSKGILPKKANKPPKETSLWARRTALRVLTLGQIAQEFSEPMRGPNNEDYLGQLVGYVRETQSASRNVTEKADEIAQKFATYAAANPRRKDFFADLAIDATMANVNLLAVRAPSLTDLMNANTHLGKDRTDGWQAKALLPGLQARFDKLNLQEKQLWFEMSKFYRNVQNQNALKLAENLLDTLTVPMANPAARGRIITNASSGVLTDQDRIDLGDDSLFRALKNARELRVIGGVYFPLMRHGGFVVKTTDNFPTDLMGGAKEGDDGVLFRDQKDAQARKAARAFAEAQKTTRVARVQKIYFDRKTGKRITADETKSVEFDTGYIVRLQTEGVQFFDSEKEAAQFIEDNKGNFARISKVLQGLDDNGVSQDLQNSQLAALMANIDSSKLSDSQKESAKLRLRQAAARLMSGNRVQQRSITRRNVKGASKDLLRNLISYGEAAGRYNSKLTYGPKVNAVLADMRKLLSTGAGTFDPKAPVRGQVLAEVERRLQNGVANVTAPPTWVQTLLTISFIDKLASPAYSIINAMQPWMVTLPYLSGKGMMNASYELSRAYKTVSGHRLVAEGIGNTWKAVRDINKFAMIDPNDVHGSILKNISNSPDGLALVALMQRLEALNLHGQDAGFETAQAHVTSPGIVNWKKYLGSVDRAARQLPTVVEQINRATTAVASYRVAIKKGMTPDEATQFALRTVENTQGDYSADNAPPVFNTTLGRLVLQFKKYAQMMTYLLYSMARRALSKASTKEERREAAKQIGTLIAMQVLMAGVLSLPGIELLKMAAIVGSLFGLGDGWDEWEERIKVAFDESMGATMSELIRRGVVTRAIGIDVSSRVGLDQMWTYGEPRSDKLEDKQAWVFQQFGAPMSFASDLLFKVPSAIGEGDAAKALEYLVPVKIFSDTTKAASDYMSGEAGLGGALLKVAGFRSAAAANKSEEQSAKVRERQGYDSEYRRLGAAYLAATSKGELAKLRAEIAAHNKRVPLRYRVFPKALDKVRARINEERVQDGLPERVMEE